MRKVTTINLNGQAYQLEEPAYEKLHSYLQRSEETLQKNPDKKEVLSDIEQAVADKCDAVLQSNKNVVTAEQITHILSQVGEVELSEESDGNNTIDSVQRKLYLVSEGSFLAGVCSGLGAFLDVSPNLIRLAFIILTPITGGFTILVYILLAIFLPSANDESKLAKAFGRPITAKEIIAKAKEGAGNTDVVFRIAQIFERIMRIIARIISIGAGIAIAALTAGYVFVLWQLVFGKINFYGQLQTINGWHEWTMLSVLYLIGFLPLLLVARITNRIARVQDNKRLLGVPEATFVVLWLFSVVTSIAFTSAYAQNFRDYADSHNGYIRAGNAQVCVESNLCGNDHNLHHHY